jgi:hypothetical protein
MKTDDEAIQEAVRNERERIVKLLTNGIVSTKQYGKKVTIASVLKIVKFEK